MKSVAASLKGTVSVDIKVVITLLYPGRFGCTCGLMFTLSWGCGEIGTYLEETYQNGKEEKTMSYVKLFGISLLVC